MTKEGAAAATSERADLCLLLGRFSLLRDRRNAAGSKTLPSSAESPSSSNATVSELKPSVSEQTSVGRPGGAVGAGERPKTAVGQWDIPFLRWLKDPRKCMLSDVRVCFGGQAGRVYRPAGGRAQTMARRKQVERARVKLAGGELTLGSRAQVERQPTLLAPLIPIAPLPRSSEPARSLETGDGDERGPERV